MTELRRRKVTRGKGTVRNGVHKSVNGPYDGLPALLQGVSVQQLLVNGFGVFMCLYLGIKHASYMNLIHENQTWFSNIKVRSVQNHRLIYRTIILKLESDI